MGNSSSETEHNVHNMKSLPEELPAETHTEENNSFNVQPILQRNTVSVNNPFGYNHEPNRSAASAPHTYAVPPSKILTKDDFMATWFSWKNEFLTYIKLIDQKESNKQKWGIMLLNRIGPIGQEIHRTFTFNKDHAEEDIDTLLKKFDSYCIFGSRKKGDDEEIDKYVNDLMLAAIASNHSDPVSIVKEKIIQDIKSYNFTGKAMLFVRSKGENLVSYLQLLNFHKIILFWKQCEELMLQKNHENIRKQPLLNSQSAEIECIRCGTCHNKNRCPAYGVQCDKCKGYNHFKDNCKVKYVSDCTKCGTHHMQSRCLAFGESCTNCGKANHFSWLCQTPTVKNCLRCGKDHAISLCPAQGQTCVRCNKPNHLKEKCLSKLNDEQN